MTKQTISLQEQSELITLGRNQTIKQVRQFLKDKQTYLNWQANRPHKISGMRERYSQKALAVELLLESFDRQFKVKEN